MKPSVLQGQGDFKKVCGGNPDVYYEANYFSFPADKGCRATCI